MSEGSGTRNITWESNVSPREHLARAWDTFIGRFATIVGRSEFSKELKVAFRPSDYGFRAWDHVESIARVLNSLGSPWGLILSSNRCNGSMLQIVDLVTNIFQHFDV